MRKAIPILAILVLIFTISCNYGCKMATENVYKHNLTVEGEVTAVMEKYELYYRAADAETRAEWSKVFDPAFDKLDLLMDTYHEMVASGLTTEAILREIDNLKTRIMIELAKRHSKGG